ncbi:hypothetical protein [Labrenzia sp. OB1]|uniref:hypothetical protein n=1 Tax=Labrenzia sp. OB1 TaxID=1561204 RepID=UPI0007B2643C|nr:hypothetical protein [Labrenzia sp. OB1]KZM47396.1 hypothetical protein OA90_26170 [Labrenzia sp. OB1]
MSNSIRQSADPKYTNQGLVHPSNECFGKDGRNFGNGSQQGFQKDARSSSQDNRQSQARQKPLDKILTERFALFEEKLLETLGDSNSDTEQEKGDDNNKENAQIVFDSSVSSRFEGPQEQDGARSETGQRAERIFKLISPHLDAAIRPGPTVLTGPMRIEIPIGNTYSGLDRVDVVLSDSDVVVKLCLPSKAGTVALDESFLLATEQLGQLLQVHFPKRRIKIERTTLLQEDHAEVESRESASSGVASLFQRTRLELPR